MNIVVCVKQVPEVTDAELEVDESVSGIELEDLVMDMNEWDAYAVEEAVRLKEAHGGSVTAVTVGDEDAEDVLRRALAMGADAAIKVDDEDFVGSDALGIARGLSRAIGALQFDLVLTGAQSSDTGWAQVGGTLAELLELPHASLAVDIEVREEEIVVHRELESNTLEMVGLPLPCLVTVQTGINEPRYVSIMGIRRVRKIEIEELETDDLGLGEGDVGPTASSALTRTIAVPGRGDGAEMLEGGVDAVCDRAAEIIRERGGVV